MPPSAIRNDSDAVEIVDIHQSCMDISLADEIRTRINPPEGVALSLPTLLLYDARGLKLFEKITYLDEYYLTNAEIEVLTANAKRIVERIPENAQMMELGSGNLRKIEILLRECERMKKTVDYYALDLSLDELKRTFSKINPESFAYVGLHGILGTYDDGLRWLKNAENRTRPTVIISIGSSIGNFSRSSAPEFLAGFAKSLNASDLMIIGLDACQDPDRVFKAYNDSEGVTRAFYENGLVHANSVLGFDAFKADEWDIFTAYDIPGGRHHAYYSPKVDVVINERTIRKGEKVQFEESVKYNRRERDILWREAALVLQAEFGNDTDTYYIHLLSPSSLTFPTDPARYAAHPVLQAEDFQTLWTTWDIVTKTMIPREELWSKPIKLRNELIFYLGHIPTFCDIHLTRALGGNPTEPSSYRQIFERGIDPDVQDPTQCHAHSETPDEWPQLDEILDYQERVRNRVRALINKGRITDRCVAEALWIGLEHEVMHLETFLYMLLQSDKVLPPVGVERPDFAHLAKQAKEKTKPNRWFTIPEQQLAIGLEDSNEKVLPRTSFGWDNEKPQRTVAVHTFEAQARPITNGEYAKFLQYNKIQTRPASWTQASQDGSTSQNSNGSLTDEFLDKFAIRSVFGPVPLKLAEDWPLMASYDELAVYAKWAKCRIPTLDEVKSIYQYSAQLHGKDCHPATNGMSNGTNGSSTNGHRSRSQGRLPVFVDLDGCNVGFRHWHPTPVTPQGDRLVGQGELGGVWEWTSTPLTPHEGFKPMEIYPSYTSDFFDGKHYVVLGGSWATIPRIAGRTTFVNWYQHNYLYAWAGARLVRDL
ncbi:hypothetical protein N7510_010479 [Penicillium lagena]|uniref:uncharacterized protein n=1 Tax=Penicillium lagena TaxID=94218 RepID=UPI002540E1FA|nr:uncharacterized protein N7510_010479 [Penicillium lagena]KAJ5605325.1 hypothetical protein N7510_010479 [Penicillium lagena]